MTVDFRSNLCTFTPRSQWTEEPREIHASAWSCVHSCRGPSGFPSPGNLRRGVAPSPCLTPFILCGRKTIQQGKTTTNKQTKNLTSKMRVLLSGVSFSLSFWFFPASPAVKLFPALRLVVHSQTEVRRAVGVVVVVCVFVGGVTPRRPAPVPARSGENPRNRRPRNRRPRNRRRRRSRPARATLALCDGTGRELLFPCFPFPSLPFHSRISPLWRY